MDYYSVLGIDRNASNDDIKQAFRRLAREHHPDRGGDENKFKQINEAYTVLNDPESKAQYDFQSSNRNPFGNGFHQQGNAFHHTFHFGDGFAQFHQNDIFEDMMKNFGFTFQQRQQPMRNRDLNIRCKISLKDSYVGKNMNITYRLPSGIDETVDFNIPPGIDNGQVIKLNGYGDNSIPNVPRGDLTIVIEVDRDNNFYREDNNLITEINIDIFDAMLGCKKDVEIIDGNTTTIDIRPGTQHGQKFSSKGLGFKNVKFHNVRGDLHVLVNVKTPAVKDPELVTLVDRLAEKIRRSY